MNYLIVDGFNLFFAIMNHQKLNSTRYYFSSDDDIAFAFNTLIENLERKFNNHIIYIIVKEFSPAETWKQFLTIFINTVMVLKNIIVNKYHMLVANRMRYDDHECDDRLIMSLATELSINNRVTILSNDRYGSITHPDLETSFYEIFIPPIFESSLTHQIHFKNQEDHYKRSSTLKLMEMGLMNLLITLQVENYSKFSDLYIIKRTIIENSKNIYKIDFHL